MTHPNTCTCKAPPTHVTTETKQANTKPERGQGTHQDQAKQTTRKV